MTENLHLVARCPGCERPLWTKQIVKLLGLAPLAKRYPDIAFIARSRAPGQGRGWKAVRSIRNLAELADVAGIAASEQLRQVAKLAFRRMWAQGMLSRADIEDVVSTVALHRPPDAPPRTLDVAPYVPPPYAPGSRLTANPVQPLPPRTLNVQNFKV